MSLERRPRPSRVSLALLGPAPNVLSSTCSSTSASAVGPSCPVAASTKCACLASLVSTAGPQRMVEAKPITDAAVAEIGENYLNPVFKFDEEEHARMLEEAARVDTALKENQVTAACPKPQNPNGEPGPWRHCRLP